MPKTLSKRVGKTFNLKFMKTSNVSFKNLLDQLSEEKINRVVDRDAVRAGWLDQLGVTSGSTSSGDSSSTGNSGASGGSGSTANNSGGICLCL
jgi:hypothetical protein